MSTTASEQLVIPGGIVSFGKTEVKGEHGYILHFDATYRLGANREAHDLPVAATRALTASLVNQALSTFRSLNVFARASVGTGLTAAYNKWYTTAVSYHKSNDSNQGHIELKNSSWPPIELKHLNQLHQDETLWINTGNNWLKKLVHPDIQLDNLSEHQHDSFHACSVNFTMNNPHLWVEEDLDRLDLVVSGQLTAMLCHHGGSLPQREVPRGMMARNGSQHCRREVTLWN